MNRPLSRRVYARIPVLLILVTIVALGIGAIALRYVETRLVEAAGESLALAAVDIAGKLDLLLAERRGDVQVLAGSPVLRGLDVAAMTVVLDSYQQAYPVYLWLSVTDRSGRVVAATDPGSIGLDYSQTPWFAGVRDDGHIVVLDAAASEESGGVLAVGFAAPIRAVSGEVLGTVQTRVGLPVLEDAFAQTANALQAQHGTATTVEYQFLGSDGTVIADSLLREEQRVNLAQRGLPSAQLVMARPAGYVEERHLRRGYPVITGYAQTKGLLSWGILVRLSREDILWPIRHVLWKLGLAGTVIWLPLFTLLLWTSRRLKEAWAQAAEHEAHLRATVGSVCDGVIATDQQGRVTFMNPLAEYLTGWSQEEAKGKTVAQVWSVLGEETRRPIENLVITVRRTGELVALPRRTLLVSHDGSEVPIEGSVSPMRDEQGRQGGVVVAFRDDSARRRAEKRQAAQLAVSLALAELPTLDLAAPRLLQGICETMGWELGSLWMVDEEGRALRCAARWHGPSVQAEEFLALTGATTFLSGVGLPGRVWERGTPAWVTDVAKEPNSPRASAARQAGLHAAFAFPITGEGQVLGVIEFFSRQVRPLDAELLDMMADVGIKIGQFVRRQRAEESARASEDRFRLAVEYATDAIFYLDATGVIRWASRCAATVTGWSVDKMVGRSLMEVFANQPLAKAHVASIGPGRATPQLMEFEVFLQDGTSRWLEATSTQVKQDEEAVGWLIVARDITERKQTEEHLRQAEKRIALGSLLDGIAHELNNPLFMISGNVQLAREAVKRRRSEGVDGELAAIQEAVQRAAAVVQRILAVSRGDGGRREGCRVGPRLSQALELTANDLAIQQIQVCTSIPADLPPVQANPNELTQVFLSVINNAREAMASAHGCGTLTVTAAMVADGEGGGPSETTNAVSGGHLWVEVRVTDDGPGIAPEFQGRIFEPFFTLKPAGKATGLGLAIAQRIVSGLGGTLTVTSEVGKGATFIVRLPAMEDSTWEQPKGTADPSPSVSGAEGEIEDNIP